MSQEKMTNMVINLTPRKTNTILFNRGTKLENQQTLKLGFFICNTNPTNTSHPPEIQRRENFTKA